MSAIHRILFGVAVSLVVSMMPIGWPRVPLPGKHPLVLLTRISRALWSSSASGHWCPKRSS